MKTTLLILLIINGLLLPCTVLLPFYAYNPLLAAFITDFHVTNNTDATISITPIGAAETDGRRSPLPLYKSVFPAEQSRQRGGFTIGLGDSCTFLYDYDDVQFSEIIIENESGELRLFIVNPNPTEDQYRPPDANTFTIDSLNDLAPVESADVRAAYNHAQQPLHLNRRLRPFVVAPWLTFIVLLLAYLRAIGRTARQQSPL